MIKTGITGQKGFIGTHLYNTIGLHPGKYCRIPFEDEYFEDDSCLEEFVSSCDVIIHLAAVNRHPDPGVIYETNMDLVRRLIEAMEKTGSRPQVIFSSSTQEDRDNAYGNSKRDGRRLLEEWARRNEAVFTGLIIPNVYGPFGKPYYNSVVATFCHQLTHNETPVIETDGLLKLLYVGELTGIITDLINTDHRGRGRHMISRYRIPHTFETSVSELLSKLTRFRNNYYENSGLPDLSDPAERNLFNTLVSYINYKEFYPSRLRANTDPRGSFVELIRLNSGGQVSFSTTRPGVTRGNHFHTRKAERFVVVKGNARIDFRRIGTDEIFSFELNGLEPSFVDMPVWHTHRITNTGRNELLTVFWINEAYDPRDPDTYFEKV